MGASYAETFFFDLIVVFFVAIVMPISVLLLRSNSTAGKLGGATLLGLSVLYVGGFEHYRLHAPEARWLALLQLLFTGASLTLSLCRTAACIRARARHAAGV
jgi:lipopolysaccharide export LptBFGC system permease protein LptF